MKYCVCGDGAIEYCIYEYKMALIYLTQVQVIHPNGTSQSQHTIYMLCASGWILHITSAVAATSY